jgi:SsrA-binding protein
MAKRPDEGVQIVADNRKAAHDFHLLETFEAGIALAGTEVKAIREGRVQLRDSYCRLEGAEAYLLGVHIGQYSHGGSASHDPTRPRKLLLRREELNKLLGKTTEKGLTIVPLRVYLKHGRVKVAIALAKGKKTIDKRETIKRREAERETRAAVKTRRPL